MQKEREQRSWMRRRGNKKLHYSTRVIGENFNAKIWITFSLASGKFASSHVSRPNMSADDWKRVVQPKLSMVLDKLTLSPSLETQLMEKDLIDYVDLESVKAKPTDDERKKDLLFKYLWNRGPGSLQQFCRALKDAGNHNLEKLLKDRIRELNNESEVVSSTTSSPCNFVSSKEYCCSVWIYMLPKYREAWKEEESKIKATITAFLRNPPKEILFYHNLYEECKHQVAVELYFVERTEVSLYYPDATPELFKKEKSVLAQNLATRYRISNHEEISVEVIDSGSCFVKLLLPGNAVMQLLIDAVEDLDALSFLELGLGPVWVGIGSLPPFSPSILNVSRSFILRMQLLKAKTTVLLQRLPSVKRRIKSCFFLLDRAEISPCVRVSCEKLQKQLNARNSKIAQTMRGLSYLNSSFNKISERLQPLEGRRKQFTETKKAIREINSACLRKLRNVVKTVRLFGQIERKEKTKKEKGNRLVRGDPLEQLFQGLPKKTSEFRRVKVNLTCFDAGRDVLAIGSDVGVVYLYETKAKRLGELPSTGMFQRHAITCIKIYEPLNHLALGTSSGLVILYRYCLKPGQRMQQFSRDDHKAGVVAMTWHNAGRFLITGDESGKVFISSIDFHTERCQSRVFYEADCSLVQLSSGAGPWALISTAEKSYFVSSETHLNRLPIPIGSKERKPGSYGACFCGSSGAAAIPYVARPGFGLWKTDMRGKVLCTLKYKELLSRDDVPLIDLGDLKIHDDGNSDLRFGLLHVFNEQYVVTHCESALWILDPMKNTVLGHHTGIGRIVAVTSTETEIYVLREDEDVPIICIRPFGQKKESKEKESKEKDDEKREESDSNWLERAVKTGRCLKERLIAELQRIRERIPEIMIVQEGNCALSIAVTNRNWSLAKLLISFGCKLNEKWGTHKQTILHLVAMQWHDDESLLFVKEIMPRVRALAACRDLNEKLPFEFAGGVMRRYLFDAWRGYRKLYEEGGTKPSRVKVCLMGNSGAGKTTLMNSLRRKCVKMSFDPRTASVNIVTAAIDSAEELVFCDFSGQPTFHKMHGLFFSEATTIFILVVNLTMSEEELATCAFYWLSFVKCSIRMKGKAMLVLVGSRGDQNSGKKLKGISNHLRIIFRKWFTMGENFVLDCREQESAGLQKLREYLGSLKQKCIEDADEVPTIVETVQLSLLPQVRDLLQKSEGDALKEMAEKNMLPQALFKLINISEGDPNKMLEALKAPHYEEIYSEINSTLQNFGLTTSQLTKIERQYIHVGLLKALIEKNVDPGLKNEELDLFVAFLDNIGEILVVENQVVLDPPWLCQSVIAPLMSPDDFPVHLEGVVNGIVSKDQVKAALEAFSEANQTGSIAVDEAIEILCHLEICYPVKELPDAPMQCRFPALIQTIDRERLWRRKEDIVLYVGRRLQCKEKTDIITPGTMPFIQSRAAIKLHPTQPLVWKGGLMMQRTINRCRIEGLIELHEYEKSIDFVVRGPHDSEGECMTLLNEMLKLGRTVLEEKSAGTDLSLLYISRADLQKLSAQPLAYASEVVEQAKQLGSTTAKVSCAVRGMTAESLKDLLAVPEDHYLLLSAQCRRAIADCLNKDTADRRAALATELHKLTASSYAQCKSAEDVLARWSESLCSTVSKLNEAATEANVLYILAMLEDGGAIQLSDETDAGQRRSLSLGGPKKKADSATDGVAITVGGASAHGHGCTASGNHKVDVTNNQN